MGAMKNIHKDTEADRLRAALDQAVATGQAAYAELEAENERLREACSAVDNFAVRIRGSTEYAIPEFALKRVEEALKQKAR